jgi:hypothetical protein
VRETVEDEIMKREKQLHHWRFQPEVSRVRSEFKGMEEERLGGWLSVPPRALPKCSVA